MHSLLYRLHITSLAALVLALIACKVPVPQPPKLTIALKPREQVQAPPTVEVAVAAETYVEAAPPAPALPVTVPPPASVPVALEGAAIVEFFGIPLDGTHDVVFVLDRSGSMEELALGQIAQLVNPAPLGQNLCLWRRILLRRSPKLWSLRLWSLNQCVQNWRHNHTDWRPSLHNLKRRRSFRLRERSMSHMRSS